MFLQPWYSHRVNTMLEIKNRINSIIQRNTKTFKTESITNSIYDILTIVPKVTFYQKR